MVKSRADVLMSSTV